MVVVGHSWIITNPYGNPSGAQPKCQHRQGKLRVPTPRNITPGPGYYFKAQLRGVVDIWRDHDNNG